MGTLVKSSCLLLSMYIKSTFLLLSCFMVLLEAKQLPEDRHRGGRPGGFGFGGSYGGSFGGGAGGSFGGSPGGSLGGLSAICSAQCQGVSCTQQCSIFNINLGTCQTYNPTGCTAAAPATAFPPRNNI